MKGLEKRNRSSILKAGNTLFVSFTLFKSCFKKGNDFHLIRLDVIVIKRLHSPLIILIYKKISSEMSVFAYFLSPQIFLKQCSVIRQRLKIYIFVGVIVSLV